MEEKALLKFRPVYPREPSWAEAAQVAVIGTVLLTIFGGTLFLILLAITGLDHFIPYWLMPTMCFLAGAVGLPPWYNEMKRRAYKKSYYAFYEDRVEFEWHPVLFFQEQVRDKLYYYDIENIGQRATFWQRQAGLCSIYIFAPVMQNPDRQGFMGLKVLDVPSNKNLQERIEGLVTGTAPELATRPAPDTAEVPNTEGAPNTEGGGEHGGVEERQQAPAGQEQPAQPAAPQPGQPGGQPGGEQAATAPAAPAQRPEVGGTGEPEDRGGA